MSNRSVQGLVGNAHSTGSVGSPEFLKLTDRLVAKKGA